MQNSLIMADLHTSRISKKSLKDEKESLIKADVVLVKKNVMLPTVLPAPEDKFFSTNSQSREKYSIKTRKSRNLKEQDTFKSTDKLTRKIDSLSLEATVIENKNLLEEKKSAPSGMQKCITSENYLSQSLLKKSLRSKSSSPNLLKSKQNDLFISERNVSEFSYSQKLLPENKKVDLTSQVGIKKTLDVIQNKSTNINQKKDSTNLQILSQETAGLKSDIEKSKYIESAKDSNILNIFSLSIDQRSSLSHSLTQNSVIKEKDNSRIFTLNRRNLSSSINESNKTSIKFKDNKNKLDCQIKYSWQDIKNWMSPQEKEIIKLENKHYDCKKTYSWQILGTSTQTSEQLLQNIDENYDNEKYQCKVKYSWQIVGKSTQASINDYENYSNVNEDYWRGVILSPRKNHHKRNEIEAPKEFSKPGNKILILYCQGTQTLSDKKTQTDLTDCRVTYSWENLINQHLNTLKSSKFDTCEQISYDKYCVDYLKTRTEPINCSVKYSWQNLIRQRLKSKEQGYYDIHDYKLDKYLKNKI